MRFAVWLTALSFAFSAVSYAQVPDLVPVPMSGSGGMLPSLGGADTGLSWVEERQIGDEIAYQIQQDPVYERDPLLHEYVNDIWQRLLNASLRDGELSKDLHQRMAWKMFLIRDPTVNAFALPGAYIGVNLGLVSIVNTRDELASVLAHESVHIFQRHIARLYAESKNFSLISIASLIIGAAAASANPSVGSAILMGGQAAAIQGQINFTRTMEYEADRIGYKVLVDAGFRPQGMAEMFQKLADAARYSDTTSYPYLRTHPLTNERIAEAQVRAGIDLHTASRPMDYQQALMGARAKVLARSQPDALRQLLQTGMGAPIAGREADSRAGDLYAGALAAVKLRQFEQANQLQRQLVEQVQGQPVAERIAQLLGAEIALAENNPAQALQWLGDEPTTVAVLARPERLLRAQTALASGQPVQAIDSLQPWVFKQTDDDVAWTLLSTAYSMNRQPTLALRAEGESRMVVGDFGGAIDRFKVALSQGRQNNATIYDLELIQARLRVAEQAQKDRMEQMR
ncbi:M48 family metalloprotease [Saezia sanguinis]|uniref:M48 family metalloprotease n=1 Tax=Saezia sanguinis TaxID=1965230 RepID=UPI00306E39F4